VALLVDDEKYPDVQWITPVSKLLPDDFVLPDPYLTEQVTIEDILSHRSGIATHDESYFSAHAKHPDNAKSMTRNLRNLEFVKPLRTEHIYCNIMFTVAVHLIETVTGMSYTEFIRTKLWKPLNMTNTFHDVPDIKANSDADRRSTPYHWDSKTSSYTALPDYPPAPEGHGAGSIFSSAGDYAKYIRALLKHSPILSETSHKALATPRSFDLLSDEKWAIPFKSEELYTMGLSLTSYRGHTLIGHYGSVPGFKAAVCFLPKFDWGLVIFGNSDTSAYLNDVLKFTLLDDVLDVREEDRIDWTAFFTNFRVMDEAEDTEKPEWTNVENVEPLGVPVENTVGSYHNVGYKGLVLEMKNGKLMADCSDRCFPYTLIFEHLTGNKFTVEMHGVWEGRLYSTIRGEIRVENETVVAVGVGLETDVKNGLIWFDRVDRACDSVVRIVM
jgi:CubicO group peptidase (beta-lactamase class C family)